MSLWQGTTIWLVLNYNWTIMVMMVALVMMMVVVAIKNVTMNMRNNARGDRGSYFAWGALIPDTTDWITTDKEGNGDDDRLEVVLMTNSMTMLMIRMATMMLTMLIMMMRLLWLKLTKLQINLHVELTNYCGCKNSSDDNNLIVRENYCKFYDVIADSKGINFKNESQDLNV